MERTQLYIPKLLHQRAKLIARKTNRPVAALYREFIAAGLETKEKMQPQKSLGALIELKLTGGPKDLSQNIDHYLYGDPTEKKK